MVLNNACKILLLMQQYYLKTKFKLNNIKINQNSENYTGNFDALGWPNAIYSEGSINSSLKQQHGPWEILILLYSFITTFTEHLLHISLEL